MKKVNLWNRLFHASELREQQKAYERLEIIIDANSSLVDALKCVTSLTDLIVIHKQAWGFGYQNENLGPCPHGMFRTNDIMEMKPEEVYLGGIWGLWTFNIPYWETHNSDTMGTNGFGVKPETRCYDLVKQQYFRLLDSNIRNIYNAAIEKKGEYQINKYVRKLI